MPKCGFPKDIYTFDNDPGGEPVQRGTGSGSPFSDLGIIIHEIKIRNH